MSMGEYFQGKGLRKCLLIGCIGKQIFRPFIFPPIVLMALSLPIACRWTPLIFDDLAL